MRRPERTMKLTLAFAASLAALLVVGAQARADATSSMPYIEVSATGSVDYVPDIARTNFGIKGVAGTAADAAMLLSQHAHAVIDALRRLGVSERDIKTTNYNLYFQPPTAEGQAVPPQAQTQSAQAQARTTLPVARMPVQQGYYYGTYVASESISVRSSVSRAGAIIDSAIKAGADQSYGIDYDSTQRDRLYRQALTQAVANAREQATAMAASARLSVVGIQSISTGSAARIVPMAARAMAAAETTPVEAGTDTISATVDVVFRVR